MNIKLSKYRKSKLILNLKKFSNVILFSRREDEFLKRSKSSFKSIKTLTNQKNKSFNNKIKNKTNKLSTPSDELSTYALKTISSFKNSFDSFSTKIIFPRKLMSKNQIDKEFNPHYTISSFRSETKTISHNNNQLNKKNKRQNNKNNNNNNILHISCATIEKIIDLFNNFEISLDLQKGTKSNNPTSLLNELMLDNNVYQLLLEVLLKRITQLKTGITNEMGTFFNNNKLDITLLSKPLPEIILFKLIKFINNINNNIN
jgi:hypothetical protein